MIKKYENKAEVAKAFALFLKELINGDKTIYISLSGGSTPKALFDYLSAHHIEDIQWDNVHFYWGDERCVPPDNNESNYKMTVDHLLSKISIPSENIHRIMGESEPEQEAARYADEMYNNIISKDGIPIFDLIILGMGDDGHTASIFPHEIQLWDADQLTAVATHPDSGQKRITITGKVINAARCVAFLVTGSNKAEKVDIILNHKQGYADLPASKVDPIKGELIWFLDEAAGHLS